MKHELLGGCLILTIWMIFATVMIGSIHSNLSDDRRDVNQDGVVNIVDLSVLAVEIEAAGR